MDADYYLETIRAVFQEFTLVNGTWDVRNADGSVERVKPQDIRQSALLTVEGELDDISGSGQTEAAHDLCTGIPAKQRQHYEVKGAGHYGIFSGRRWRELVYPQLKAFIDAHDAPQKRAVASAPAAVTAEDTVTAKPARRVSATAPAKKAVPRAAAKTPKPAARKTAATARRSAR
jgi:poly(3-hydroxybutyrate) depolymerase